MSASGLPATINRYLERAVSGGSPAPQYVEITQTGEMFMKPGGRAMPFTATEWFAVDRIGFQWRARFRIAPLASLRVRDGYEDGEGVLEVRVLGIPVQKQSGQAVSVGEAYRYLAELPWVPYAMSANAELEWRELDERRVEVAAMVSGERAGVILESDGNGDIVRASAAGRPRNASGSTIPTPWAGDFANYRTLGGIRMPTRGEVYWELPEGRFVYWRGHVTGAQAAAPPH